MEDVTTPSLDALQAFSLGLRVMVREADSSAAIPYFQRAVSLDPNFAAAHLGLGILYSNIGDSARSADSVRRAYELKRRASAREQLGISANYEFYVTGNLKRAQATSELWAQTYPRDVNPQIALCLSGIEMGNYAKAIEAGQKAVRLKPESAVVVGNLAEAYLNVGRLDEARNMLGQVPARANYESFVLD